MARRRQDRRSPGEGGIYLRKDSGRYRASITVGYNESGNPTRLTRDWRTYAEAEEWLTRQRADFSRGTLLVARAETLDERITTWLASKARSVTPGTHRDYADALTRLVSPHLGAVLLSDLRPAHIEHLLNSLHANGHSPYTLAKAHRYLSMVLADAVRLELVARNVTQAVPRPRVMTIPYPRWSAEQASLVLQYCQAVDDPVARYMVLGLTSGLRREELLGLRWQDVGASSIDVRQTVTYLRGRTIMREMVKTAAGWRTVHLDEAAMRALAAQREHVDLAREAATRWTEHDLVFPSSVGTPLSERHLRERFRALVAAVGVPTIRLYDLRSTHGSILADAGVNPKLISERLGHADVAFTFDRYVRTQPVEARKVATAFREALSALDEGADGAARGSSRGKAASSTGREDGRQ